MADPSHRARFLGGLAAGLVVAIVLSWAWFRGASEAGHEVRSRAEAVRALGTLASDVEKAGGEGEGARAAVAAWQRQQPRGTVARVVVLSGARLEASTDPGDTGARAAPRRLGHEEKPFFDRAVRVRGLTAERRAAGSKEPVVEVVLRDDGGFSLAAPVEREGAILAAVEVERPPTPPPAPPGLLAALLALALPLAAFWAIGRATSRRGPLVAAALLLYAAGVAGYAVWGARLAGAGAGAARALLPAAALGLAVLLFGVLGAAGRVWASLARNRAAYLYIVPAMLGMVVLVFFPFLYGVALSFTDSNIYNTNQPLPDIWIGLRNYLAIVSDVHVVRRAADGSLVFNYLSFYWTLFFTIAWTVTNVAIGVTSGLVLALVLNTKGLALRPIYRVLLILPWATPNYITALIWKGMFHRQFGVVNQAMAIVGLEPISWFDSPFTSYLTALTTNAWLSFPFMMMVALGALQSIPADIYEAARVDGATRWQRFVSITLPSLKPALVPAVILSVVWTFNMFNIIFLVTAGEPGRATEILITQAYKYAFEQYRYGYAAAYSTIIFALLLVYGVFQNRVTRATEGI
ncbi:carbohydrate ABC transporter permease [Anaeromyxobacter oryzae]|uniref:ABC transmembrane type-1 domain-containing protein n=1 Tax=Anaeromyxobacter oryzae TaxID=2918170 RepID=A0ABM7WV22_9BACT|nr:sugar ABC transporter permease [Anaeromyxobacter oryzae]BDG03244.1 hypothetical protein AMOR_22400 [Anaeromyxobacter oryzae]